MSRTEGRREGAEEGIEGVELCSELCCSEEETSRTRRRKEEGDSVNTSCTSGDEPSNDLCLPLGEQAAAG